MMNIAYNKYVHHLDLTLNQNLSLEGTKLGRLQLPGLNRPPLMYK